MQRQFGTKISRRKPPCARSPQTCALPENQFPDTASDGPAREPEASGSPPPPLRRRAAAEARQPRTPVTLPGAARGSDAPGAGRPPRRGSCAARGVVTRPVSPLVSPPPPGGAGAPGAQRGAAAPGADRRAQAGRGRAGGTGGHRGEGAETAGNSTGQPQRRGHSASGVLPCTWSRGRSIRTPRRAAPRRSQGNTRRCARPLLRSPRGLLSPSNGSKNKPANSGLRRRDLFSPPYRLGCSLAGCL